MYEMEWLTVGRGAQVEKIRKSLLSAYQADRNHAAMHLFSNHQGGGKRKLEARTDACVAEGNLDYNFPHAFTMFTCVEDGKTYCMDPVELMQMLSQVLVNNLDEIDDWLTGEYAQQSFVFTYSMGKRVGEGVIAEIPGRRTKYASCKCNSVRVVLLPNRGKFQGGEHLPFFLQTAYPVVSGDTWDRIQARSKEIGDSLMAEGDVA